MTEIRNIEKEISTNNISYIADIKSILSSARNKAYSAVNAAMVEAYWQIGFPEFEIMRTPLAQSELSSNLQKLNWAQIQRIINTCTQTYEDTVVYRKR